MHDLVLLTNAEHVVTYASTAVPDQLGFPAGELVGTLLDDLVHPDDLPALWRHRAHEQAGARPVPLLARLRRADGGHQWFSCRLSTADDPVHDAGSVTVVSARDATAVVDLEERVALTDLRYRTLLGALAEAVVFLDARLRVELVNDEGAAVLGWRAGHLLGRGYFDALAVRDEGGRPVTMESPFAMRLLHAAGRAETWCSVLREDGTPVLLHHRWTPLPGGSSGPRGFVLTMQGALGPRAGTRAPVHRRQAQAAAGLTPREGDVLEALAAGHDLVTIAGRLRISLHSVRGHLKSLMRKLGARSQLQVVVAAARLGMVEVGGAGA
jgi:PAS domain S-box-containing protein